MLLHPTIIAPMSPQPGWAAPLQGAPSPLQNRARCCPCFGKASAYAGHWRRATPSDGSQGQPCGGPHYYLVLAEVSCLGAWGYQYMGMELCMMAPMFSTDEAWTEVIDTLTVAAIRFEMLSTAHRSQVGQ